MHKLVRIRSPITFGEVELDIPQRRCRGGRPVHQMLVLELSRLCIKWKSVVSLLLPYDTDHQRPGLAEKYSTGNHVTQHSSIECRLIELSRISNLHFVTVSSSSTRHTSCAKRLLATLAVSFPPLLLHTSIVLSFDLISISILYLTYIRCLSASISSNST